MIRITMQNGKTIDIELDHSAAPITCENFEKLVKDGWTYWRGGRHGRLQAPSGHPTLTIGCTPSDRRAFQNFRRDLRNALSRQTTATQNRTNHQPARLSLTATIEPPLTGI